MKRIVVIVATLILLLGLYLFIPKVETNFDMTIYLPDASQTKQGLAILEDEFETSTTLQIMIEGISIDDVLLYKSQLINVAYVMRVIWLDDFVDLSTTPIEFIPDDIRSRFLVEDNALLTLIFQSDAYNIALENSISSIETILAAETYYMRAEMLTHIEARTIAEQEVIKIMVLVIPVIILILLLASHAWVEPLLILVTLGIAVLFNVLTNGLLGQISFITQTMALVLQLALSIDYALFMIHRYYEERKSHDKLTSSRLAIRHTFKSITASALTTIAGFTALFFMKYQIGLDIGLVLSKGILFSYLSTLIILPILLIWFDTMIEKSKHKMLIPPLGKLFDFQYKYRYALIILLIVSVGIGIYGASKVDYLYGASALDKNSEIRLDKQHMDDTFGIYQPVVIIVPNTSISQELGLVTDLASHPNVIGIDALVTQVDPMIPRDQLPVELLSSYVGPYHSRFIIYVNLEEESAETSAMIESIKLLIESHYETFYMVGEASAIYDIKTSVIDQNLFIMLFTVCAVAIIIGLIFKSITIPILLVGVILSSVWINVSILYFLQTKVIYIGYLVVMSIQLGATIDYSVLLTHRYIEERKSLSKKDAMHQAFNKSGLTILISGSILMIAGFTEGIFSHIDAVTNIGLLLGKGAFISFMMTFMFLPTLLVVLDSLIIKRKKAK